MTGAFGVLLTRTHAIPTTMATLTLKDQPMFHFAALTKQDNIEKIPY